MEKSSTNSSALSSRNKLFTKLPLSFFQRSAEIVAEELLGKVIVRVIDDKPPAIALIVETEAYLGSEDPASHAFRGITQRNAPMFESGGLTYVYFTYGVHHCVNVVTGKKGEGQAVLLRALEPLSTPDWVWKNRRLAKNSSPHQLYSGPGKICQALEIGRELNFHPLSEPPLLVAKPGPGLGKLAQQTKVHRSRRIGITKGVETPFRFCLEGSNSLSRRLAPYGA